MTNVVDEFKFWEHRAKTEQDIRIIKKYLGGMSLTQISKEENIPRSTIYVKILRAGLNTRSVSTGLKVYNKREKAIKRKLKRMKKHEPENV